MLEGGKIELRRGRREEGGMDKEEVVGTTGNDPPMPGVLSYQ